MFKRIKELNREHPVGSVFFRYVLLWLIICIALTAWLGNDRIETAAKNTSRRLKKNIDESMESVRKFVLSSGSNAEKKEELLKKCMESILSDVQKYTEGKVYGYYRVAEYNEEHITNLKLDISSADTDKNDLNGDMVSSNPEVTLVLKEGDEVSYLTCPYWFWFGDVYDETQNLYDQDFFVSDAFSVYLTKGYRKGDEFRPWIANIKGYGRSDKVERFCETDVICSLGNGPYWIPEDFEDGEIENLSSDNNMILIPSYYYIIYPNPLTESEMIAESLDSYGDKAARYFTYLCYCWDSWSLHPNEYFNLESLEHRFLTHLIGEDDPSAFGFGNYEVLQLKKDGNPYSGFKVPFSELKGDLSLEYYNILGGADGEKLRVMFFCIIKNGLGREMEEFYRSMLPVYIGLAVFFLFLAWYWLKHFYSLEGKSRFHKSLINSMAHDLKTPLMIMQGFSENLKDDIHREKHGYYAEQIVENAEYLNGLINKNLDVSNKAATDLDKNETVHLSELVKKAEKRYKERLEDKNLKIKQEGVSFLEGDPEIIGIMMDNLISNAIKYSFDGETIEVFGDIKYFTIKNKAELHYNKNLKHLLDPLEMGDESRTAGSGTGLGLSIANGIAQECGWRLKLSYDRVNKIFTCKVILRKWL